jgi:hypothetical protein
MKNADEYIKCSSALLFIGSLSTLSGGVAFLPQSYADVALIEI